MSNRQRSFGLARFLWVVIFIVAVGLYFLIPNPRSTRPSAPSTNAPSTQRVPTPGSQGNNGTGTPRNNGTSGQRADANTNVALGNSSGATTDVNNANNYLIERAQYVLSYNRDGGIPNWVSWHLSAADLGSVDRSDFQPDTSLPQGWYQVKPSDYTNSGYDRGHMAPSADRTANVKDNEEMFLMTNIVPQAPDNNQGPWVGLEQWCRDQTRAGNELYITSGVNGTKETLSKGKVRVPKSLWKVIVVLPEGNNDLQRINARTEVVAVELPNQQGIRNNDWQKYLTSVSRIQQETGYDLLSNVDPAIQAQIEARVTAP